MSTSFLYHAFGLAMTVTGQEFVGGNVLLHVRTKARQVKGHHHEIDDSMIPKW